MKITKNYLKQVIKEEISKSIRQQKLLEELQKEMRLDEGLGKLVGKMMGKDWAKAGHNSEQDYNLSQGKKREKKDNLLQICRVGKKASSDILKVLNDLSANTEEKWKDLKLKSELEDKFKIVNDAIKNLNEIDVSEFGDKGIIKFPYDFGISHEVYNLFLSNPNPNDARKIASNNRFQQILTAAHKRFERNIAALEQIN